MGKLMAFRQWRPAKGDAGEERRERQSWRMCMRVCVGLSVVCVGWGGVVGGRQYLIKSKTNGGKDWVKEQEELQEGGKEEKQGEQSLTRTHG